MEINTLKGTFAVVVLNLETELFDEISYYTGLDVANRAFNTIKAKITEKNINSKVILYQTAWIPVREE